MALATLKWGWAFESGYLRGTDTVTRGLSHSHVDAIDETFNLGKREKKDAESVLLDRLVEAARDDVVCYCDSALSRLLADVL